MLVSAPISRMSRAMSSVGAGVVGDGIRALRWSSAILRLARPFEAAAKSPFETLLIRAWWRVFSSLSAMFSIRVD